MNKNTILFTNMNKYNTNSHAYNSINNTTNNLLRNSSNNNLILPIPGKFSQNFLSINNKNTTKIVKEK